jgi:NAD(P)-dependent dehydrogenase (short-subunit alcohol dehydrogenase family)
VFRPAPVHAAQTLLEYLTTHDETLTRNLEGNMRTALLVTEAAVYMWKKHAERGTVIFEGDAFIERSGSYPRNLAAYTASKAYIPSVVHQLAEQHGREGIRFLGVLNGTIEPPKSASAETIAHMRGEIPLPEAELNPWIGATRVAEAIDHLIAMKAVNGTTLTVDGGRTWTTKEEF